MRCSPAPSLLPEPRTEPLTDSAVSALFGEGDNAWRTLIQAWLEEGRVRMRTPVPSTKDALRARLHYNEPALAHLPEVSRGAAGDSILRELMLMNFRPLSPA